MLFLGGLLAGSVHRAGFASVLLEAETRLR
jgi:hypothetical protein